MLGCHLEVQALFDVEPRCFEPPPAVTSAVVRLSPLPSGHFEIADEQLLGRTVATAFSQRRKTVRNALKSLVNESELAELGIDASVRPEMLEIRDYVALANYLARRPHDSG